MTGFGIASAVGGIFGAFGVIISLALSVVLGVYIYRDANSRGLNGTLWLLIVVTSWFVGLIVYIIVRSDSNNNGPDQHYQ